MNYNYTQSYMPSQLQAPQAPLSTFNSGLNSFAGMPAARTETTVEETSYSNINGHIHQEEHSAHTLNNQLLDKKDLVIDDGLSRGQEFHVDAWGQPITYNIGNSLL